MPPVAPRPTVPVFLDGLAVPRTDDDPARPDEFPVAPRPTVPAPREGLVAFPLPDPAPARPLDTVLPPVAARERPAAVPFKILPLPSRAIPLALALPLELTALLP